MNTDRPDEAAYGRVTNPNRFKVVVDATLALIEGLAREFDVTRVRRGTEITLTPREGVPLGFTITDFPGIEMRFGDWGRAAFPSCGCDACDEPLDGLIEEMNPKVGAAVDGRYDEELTNRRLRYYSSTGDGGGSSSQEVLTRAEAQELGLPAVHRWPRRPRRTSD